MSASHRRHVAERKMSEYASLMEAVASAAAARLEEVRLPLHILLENRFGDLNENQEEMLGAARAAAEAIDSDIIALRQIAQLDLGKRELRSDRILPGDMVRALAPTLQALAQKANATLTVDIEPGVPAIHGDLPLLHDALATLLGDVIRNATEGSTMELTVGRRAQGVAVCLRGGGALDRSVRVVLAERIVMAAGGQVTQGDSGLTITL